MQAFRIVLESEGELESLGAQDASETEESDQSESESESELEAHDTKNASETEKSDHFEMELH